MTFSGLDLLRRYTPLLLGCISNLSITLSTAYPANLQLNYKYYLGHMIKVKKLSLCVDSRKNRLYLYNFCSFPFCCLTQLKELIIKAPGVQEVVLDLQRCIGLDSLDIEVRKLAILSFRDNLSKLSLRRVHRIKELHIEQNAAEMGYLDHLELESMSWLGLGDMLQNSKQDSLPRLKAFFSRLRVLEIPSSLGSSGECTTIDLRCYFNLRVVIITGEVKMVLPHSLSNVVVLTNMAVDSTTRFNLKGEMHYTAITCLDKMLQEHKHRLVQDSITRPLCQCPERQAVPEQYYRGLDYLRCIHSRILYKQAPLLVIAKQRVTMHPEIMDNRVEVVLK